MNILLFHECKLRIIVRMELLWWKGCVYIIKNYDLFFPQIQKSMKEIRMYTESSTIIFCDAQARIRVHGNETI